MKNIKRNATRFGFIAAMLFALGTTAIAPVSAQTIGTSGTLAGGTFAGSTNSAAITFASTTFNGVAQSSAGTQSAPFKVSDLRGTTNGWSVSVTTSPFANGGTSLANDALSLVAGTVALDINTHPGQAHGLAATSTSAGAVGLTTGGTAAVIYTTGLATDTSGDYLITPAYALAFAATDKPGTYTGTLTYTFATTV